MHEFAKLVEALAAMTRTLCDSLTANARSGRTIGIKVRLDDWTTVTRAHSIAEPTCDYETVFAVALRLLREYAPARPVRLLGVRVAGLTHGERAPARESAPADDAADGAPAVAGWRRRALAAAAAPRAAGVGSGA